MKTTTEITTPTAIATFEDRTGGNILENLNIAIEPVQDLHGYDSPWVGGAGKNKLNVTGTTQTISGVTYTVNSDGSVKANGTASANAVFYLNSSFEITDSQEYIFSGCTGGAAATYRMEAYYRNSSSTSLGTVVNYSGDTHFKLSDKANCVKINTFIIVVMSGATVNNVVFKPMVRLASVSDSSFAPYANICPITGFTEAKITRAGKNLLPNGLYNYETVYINNGITFTRNADGSVTTVGTASANTFYTLCNDYVFKAGSYRLSGGVSDNAIISLRLGTTGGTQVAASSGSESATFTFAEDTACGAIIRIASGTTVNDTFYPMLRLTDSEPGYEPYYTTTYPISFSSAGTVYGGELDVDSGTLTVNKRYILLDGTEDWNVAPNDLQAWFYYPRSDIQYSLANIPVLSDRFSYTATHPVPEGTIFARYRQIHIRPTADIYPSGLTSAGVTEFKNWLANNNTQIVVDLETPLVYQLTPQQVETVAGMNNVWSDTGNILSLFVEVDNIDKLTSPVTQNDAINKINEIIDALPTEATDSDAGLMSGTEKQKVANTNVYWCTCATAAATATKVVTPNDPTGFNLAPGTIIGVKFTNTNTASSVKLDVNNTGAKSIYQAGAVYTGTDQYITGRASYVTYYMYDGTYWVFFALDGYWGNTYDRTYLSNNGYTAKSAITAGNLIVADSTGTYFHLKSGAAFDITYPMLYAGSNCNAGAANDGGYLIVPLTITTTQSITLTANQDVYVKGTLSGTTFTPVSTAPLTQTVPTSADEYYYYYVGKATKSNVVYLYPEHKIYAFKNGAFTEYVRSSTYADSASTAVGYLKLTGGTMTGELKTSFRNSVAFGSRQATSTNISDLINELRYSSGCCGSFYLGTAYTQDGYTIPVGWHNYIWIPHRSGGVNGAASGDNCNYGALYITAMNVTAGFGKLWLINYYNTSISKLVELSDTAEFLNSHPEAPNPNGYVTDDTHILELGYLECTQGYDHCVLLVSSEFWGNQHGSCDLISIQQDRNANTTDKPIHCAVTRTYLGGYTGGGMNSPRNLYYKIDDTNHRLYIYSDVYGGNGYGRWQVTVLQTNATWIREILTNQPTTNLVQIPYTYPAGMKNNTTAGNLGWTSAANDIMPITSNTLAYWNGRYDATRSNLAYCSKGAFGNLAVKDSLTKADVGLGNVDNTADADKTVSKANTLTTARTIDGVTFNGSANITHYGTCTISGTAGAVPCTGFTLATGAWIAVHFPSTNASSSTDPLQLNVNQTGGKQVKYYLGSDQSLPANAYVFSSNRTYMLVYDGSAYRIVGDFDTHASYDAGTLAQLQAGTVEQDELWSPKILHNYVSGNYVGKTGNETVAGNKTFSGTTTLSAGSKFTAATGDAIVADSTAIIQSPIPKYLWHDVWANCRACTPTFYTTTDKTTWTQGTLNKTLFQHRQAITPVTIINATYAGARWQWVGGSLAWSGASWLVLGVTYSATPIKFDVLLEASDSSGDSATWTTLVDRTELSASAQPVWIKTNTPSVNNIRLTITRNDLSSGSTASFSLVSIMWITTRWGDQGKGSEWELPFSFDNDYNIAPLFNGKFIGDLTGNVNNHTVNSDVPANAVFTDTIRNRIYTATCTTGASTAAKVATLEESSGFSLETGVRVAVRFQYGNTATTPTLNVNSSGAKTIAYPTSATVVATGSGSTFNSWGAYETVLFTYNGTYWVKEATGLLAYLAYSRADDAKSIAQQAYAAIPAAGTAAILSTGTDTANRTWSAQILHDYIAGAAGNYGAGTDALLTAGTDTAERTWQAKILHDYMERVYATRTQIGNVISRVEELESQAGIVLPTTWSKPTVSNSCMTINAGGYYTEGRHCYVQMKCTMATGVSADSALTLATGMPVPLDVDEAPLSITVRSRTSASCYVKSTGDLAIVAGASTAISANHVIRINGVYTINAEANNVVPSAWLSNDAKTALLEIFNQVAYIGDDGQDYWDILYDSFYPPAGLLSISASYTQPGTVYDTATLNDLKPNLTVTGSFDDQSTRPITHYTLSGTIQEGTCTITVTYLGMTTTFNVVVTHLEVPPLYTFPTITEQVYQTSNKISISDGNHIFHQPRDNSRTMRIYNDRAIVGGLNTNYPLFMVTAGDTLTMKLKNITYANNGTSEQNKFTVALSGTSDADLVTTGDVSIPRTASGTIANITVTGTVASNDTVYCVRLFNYRGIDMEFDVEIYLNNTRYY